MENKRNFVGNGTRVEGYPLVNFSVNLSKITSNDTFKGSDGNTYVKLTIGEKREAPDQYGKTHSVWVDEYKPEEKEGNAAPQTKQADALPF